jgi:hypothetical protein
VDSVVKVLSLNLVQRVARQSTHWSLERQGTVSEAKLLDPQRGKQVRRQMLNQRDLGLLRAGTQVTFRANASEVFFNSSDEAHSRTRSSYSPSLGLHISPTFGNIRVTDISPQEIEALQNKLRATKDALSMQP